MKIEIDVCKSSLALVMKTGQPMLKILKKQKNLMMQLNVLDSMEKCSEDHPCKN